jgi:hypothetical protein
MQVRLLPGAFGRATTSEGPVAFGDEPLGSGVLRVKRFG